MPASAAQLAGLSVAEIRLAAQAYKRLRRRSLLETIQDTLANVFQDNSLENAFQDALFPKMLYRKEDTRIPLFEVLDTPADPEDVANGVFRATIVVNDPILAAQLAADPNIPTELTAGNFDLGPGKQAPTDQD